jgi:hypothetical protein
MGAYAATDAKFERYGTPYFGLAPYGGYQGQTIVESQDALGVPFLVGNDRYQVVVCSDSGTLSASPEFRYWYAAAPPWTDILALDDDTPTFHAVDEDGMAVAGELELPFRENKSPSEWLITGAIVEYTPMPRVVSPMVDEETVVGFDVTIEGYGLPSFSTMAGFRSTGVKSSATVTVAEDLAIETDDPWPNTRTIFVPCRIGDRVRAARVLITNLTLCEINRVSLWGDSTPLRDA